MTHWLQRIGQSDGDTFVNLIAKLGNNTTAFWAAIGYEGATSLAAKLTAARAALLDQITALRMAELDAANIPADIDTLLARLTAARAGYLDELAAANIPADVDTLITRVGDPSLHTFTSLTAKFGDNTTSFWAAIGYEGATSLAAKLTAARAALLDQITALRMAELDAANLPADIDTLLARLTAARAGYLDELAAANIPADVDTLLARLTAARAGYLDELAAANLPADIDTLLARLTALRAGYLDNLSGGAVALAASWTAALATALGNYTAARAAYLDNINQAGLLQVTAARAALLDQITALRLAELDAANLPADIDTLLARLTAARGGYMDFMPRVLAVSVTAAANAGITTIATVATQPVIIDSIVLHADAAQTGDLTSAAIQGGVGQVVTFISAAEAAAANLNAADKQVAWVGAVRLAVGKTIIVNLVGTGVTAVDLTIVLTYHSEVAGGSLS